MWDGCWMGSHMTMRQDRGSLYPHRPLCGAQLLYTLTWPVQCSTCQGWSSGAGPRGASRRGLSGHRPLCCPTFQVADLRLTVRPLLVTVHFILMKKSRSVDMSLIFFPKLEPGWTRMVEAPGFSFQPVGGTLFSLFGSRGGLTPQDLTPAPCLPLCLPLLQKYARKLRYVHAVLSVLGLPVMSRISMTHHAEPASKGSCASLPNRPCGSVRNL